MVTHAAKAVVDGKVDPEKAEYSLGTLLLARVMGSLALADARFEWLSNWLKEFNHRSGQVDDYAPARLMEAYLRMNEAQRRTVDGLESATTVEMTELQRLAALRAFESVQRGQDTGSPDDVEVRQLRQWMLTEYLSTLNGYLSATRHAPLKHLSAVAAEVEAVQASELQRSRNTVTQQLAPQLARRDRVMDMASFQRLSG